MSSYLGPYDQHPSGVVSYGPNYVSYANDGRRIRVTDDRPCEWCGKTIPKNQLAVMRSYKIPSDGYSYHNAMQHLTCYDKTVSYVYECGPRFQIHVQQPIWALS